MPDLKEIPLQLQMVMLRRAALLVLDQAWHPTDPYAPSLEALERLRFVLDDTNPERYARF